MWNPKNKTNVNITKKEQTHRYREQTSGYQQEERRRRAKTWIGDLEVQTTMCKINKLQRYIVQHREYSQYCIITLNGV